MGETRTMDFGIDKLTERIEKLAENYETDKLKEATEDINNAAKGVEKMTRAVDNFNKKASKIPKKDENFLIKYKSFSKKEALDKIDKASNLGGANLVQMVNAYRAQFDDFEKLTEKEFGNIVKIREKYNKFIATNLTKEGKQSYSDEIYSLSPAKIKEKLDKYPDWQAPSVDIKVNFEVNEDSLKVVEERKKKIINELNGLDKGKEVTTEFSDNGVGLQKYTRETERILEDRNALKKFAQYYTELEAIIKDFGGEIPERIQEIYASIEKNNKDGALRIQGSLDDGIKSYNKFKKNLKDNIANNVDLNKPLEDFEDEYVERFETVKKSIRQTSKDVTELINGRVKENAHAEDYYTTKLNSLEFYIQHINYLREQLQTLKNNGMSDKDISAADSFIEELDILEKLANDKLYNIRHIYDEAKKKTEETEDLVRQFRSRVLNNKDWWHGTDYSDEELEEYMDKIRNGFTDIDALYNDLSNRIEKRMQQENEAYDFSADPDNFEETEEGLDHVDEKVNDTITDTEKLVEALKSLTEEVGKISKSIGTIDEESGVENLITQFSNLISKIEELQGAINAIDFNISIEQPDAEEDFWKKELNRVRTKYSSIIKQAGGLEKLSGEFYNTSYTGDIGDITSLFSIKNLESVKDSKGKLENYLNFFRYLKEVRQHIQGYIDNAKLDYEEAKNNFEAAKASGDETLQTKYEKLMKAAQNTINDAFYNAVLNATKSLPSSNINDYIKRNREQLSSQENVQIATATVNSVIGGNNENNNLQQKFGDLTPVIADLKAIYDLLEKISNNKGLSETIVNITSKLDSMQQSFRDLIRNLTDAVKNMAVVTTAQATDSVNVKPEFNVDEFITEVDKIVSSEKVKFSELADYISTEIPKAIEIKNKAFQNEEGIVSQVVNNELNNVRNLKEELGIEIPKAISEVNSEPNNQIGVVDSEEVNSNIEEIILNEQKLKETSASVAETIAKEYHITGNTIGKIAEQVQYLFKTMARGGSFNLDGILNVLANYGHIKENAKLLHSDYYDIRERISKSKIKISYGDSTEFGDEWNTVRSTIGLKNITSTGTDALVILQDLREDFGNVLEDAQTTQEAIRILYEYLRDNKPDFIADFIETEELTDGINHLKSNLLEAFDTVKNYKEEFNSSLALPNNNDSAIQGVQEDIEEVGQSAEVATEKVVALFRAFNSEHGFVGDKGITWLTDSIDNVLTYLNSALTNKDAVGMLKLDPSKILSIDANGNTYEEIKYLGDGTDDLSKKMIDLDKRITDLRSNWHSLSEEQKEELENLENQYDIISNDTSNLYGTHDTDWIMDTAKNLGYAALQIKNVDDSFTGTTGELTTTFALLDRSLDKTFEDVFEKVAEYGSLVDNLNQRIFNSKDIYGDTSDLANKMKAFKSGDMSGFSKGDQTAMQRLFNERWVQEELLPKYDSNSSTYWEDLAKDYQVHHKEMIEQIKTDIRNIASELGSEQNSIAKYEKDTFLNLMHGMLPDADEAGKYIQKYLDQVGESFTASDALKKVQEELKKANPIGAVTEYIQKNGIPNREEYSQYFVDLALKAKEADEVIQLIAQHEKELSDEIPDSSNPVSSLAENTDKDIDGIFTALKQLEDITGDTLKSVISFWDDYDDQVKESASDILKNIGLMDDQGNFLLKMNSGEYATAYLIDDFVLLQREVTGTIEDTEKLFQLLKEAKSQGINVIDIEGFSQSNNKNYIYEIQKQASGNILHSNKDVNNLLSENQTILSATHDQLLKFIQDAIKLDELGINVDFNHGENFFYEAEKGFQFIDLSLRDINEEVGTSKQLFYSLFRLLSESKSVRKIVDNKEIKESIYSVMATFSEVFSELGLISEETINEELKDWKLHLLGISEENENILEEEKQKADAVSESTEALKEYNEVSESSSTTISSSLHSEQEQLQQQVKELVDTIKSYNKIKNELEYLFVEKMDADENGPGEAIEEVVLGSGISEDLREYYKKEKELILKGESSKEYFELNNEIEDIVEEKKNKLFNSIHDIFLKLDFDIEPDEIDQLISDLMYVDSYEENPIKFITNAIKEKIDLKSLAEAKRSKHNLESLLDELKSGYSIYEDGSYLSSDKTTKLLHQPLDDVEDLLKNMNSSDHLGLIDEDWEIYLSEAQKYFQYVSKAFEEQTGYPVEFSEEQNKVLEKLNNEELTLEDILTLWKELNIQAEKGVLLSGNEVASKTVIGNLERVGFEQLNDVENGIYKKFDTMLHSHADGMGTFSPEDINFVIENWEQGIRKLLLFVDGEIQKLDFSDLSKDQVEKFKEEFSDEFSNAVRIGLDKGQDVLKDNNLFSALKSEIISPLLDKYNVGNENIKISDINLEKKIEDIKEEGQVAEKAAEQKSEFVSANEKVSESGKETADNIQSASESIIEEGKAAEQSSTIMNDAFNKIQDSIKRILGEQEEFTESNENVGKSALSAAEKLEEEMDVADALFNVLTTHSKTIVGYNGTVSKLNVTGKQFTAQTVAGRKVSMRPMAKFDPKGNFLGYDTIIDQQTDYMKIVNQAAKAIKDLQKAEHNRAIQLQKNPDSKNIKEYDNLIAEAKQRLDAATVAARKFAEENEFFINDTKYGSKYLMGIFNRNVAQAVAADTSKENIRYNKAVESTQKQAEKQIEAVNNKLSQQKIILDAIQHTYDKEIAPGVSKPVTNEDHLNELKTVRSNILEEIERLQNNPDTTEEDLRLLRERVAAYKQLVKARKDENNPTKRELGGQDLEVAIQQQLAAYDKAIDKSKQFGAVTEEITKTLLEEKRALEENKNISSLYNAQNFRKSLEAQLKSIEVTKRREKIEEQAKERGEILSNKQLIALNELIEKEQELKELGLYTDKVKEKLGELLELAANPGKFTGLTKFRTELQLFNQEMKAEVQNRKKELKDKEKANQPKKESTKVTDEEKLNQVYDDLIRKYQELLSLKQKLRATSDGEDTQGLEANIKNIEKDITNLERRRHTLTDKGIDNADKLDTYLSSMKKYTTYEEQFLSAQEKVDNTYNRQIENLKEIDKLRRRNVTVAGKEIGEEEARNKELINALLKENKDLEEERNSILENNNKEVRENIKLQEELNKKEEESQQIETDSTLKTNDKLNNQIYNKIKSLDKLDVNKYINEARIELEALQKYIADIREKPIEFTTDEGIDKLKQINDLFNKFQKHRNASEFLIANENMLRKLEQKIQSFQQKNSGMGNEFMKQFEDLKLKITPEMSKEDAMNLANEFIKLQTEVTKADKLGKSFFKTIGEHLKSINAQFIAQYLSFQDLLRYARSAFETVRQLDTALVDLKKTTTMNNTDLEEFYINSSKIAKETGVTTQEIITQAAAWSRLGFSSKEAAETMAKLSSQFAKISPGTSVEDATDYLVSTMKAFHIDVADVESEIMDTINRIGKLLPKHTVMYGAISLIA